MNGHLSVSERIGMFLDVCSIERCTIPAKVYEQLHAHLTGVRNEALEEAARICMLWAEPEIVDSDRIMEARSLLVRCAANIRALKDKSGG